MASAGLGKTPDECRYSPQTTIRLQSKESSITPWQHTFGWGKIFIYWYVFVDAPGSNSSSGQQPSLKQSTAGYLCSLSQWVIPHTPAPASTFQHYDVTSATMSCYIISIQHGELVPTRRNVPIYSWTHLIGRMTRDTSLSSLCQAACMHPSFHQEHREIPMRTYHRQSKPGLATRCEKSATYNSW